MQDIENIYIVTQYQPKNPIIIEPLKLLKPLNGQIDRIQLGSVRYQQGYSV